MVEEETFAQNMKKFFINNNKKNTGFSITELLIVIVVIGILTAITYVSYSGISDKSKTFQATNNAQLVKKAAEAYKLQHGRYPSSVNDFYDIKNGSLTKEITLLTSGQSLSTNKSISEVLWKYDGTAGDSTGGTAQYWDFSTKDVSTTILKTGTGLGTTQLSQNN